MNASPESSAAPDAVTPPFAPDASPAPTPPAASVPIGWVVVAGLLAVLALAALAMAWNTQSRMRELEETLVKRQQAVQEQAADARLAARQAQDVARDSAARVAVMELRVAESLLQRSQIEELMQSVARSRDEGVLAEVEASLRVAMQQTAITGSAEPLLYALQQADERLARFNEPRLERVRQAIQADIASARAVSIADVAALTLRLDEAVRAVDGLPLLASPEPRRLRAAPAPPAASAASAAASAPAAAGSRVDDWSAQWQRWRDAVWADLRSLVRVTPVDQPEAMLIAPDQRFFLRENLKLRLLNARLALLSRQFDTARSDLRDARLALERYFDRTAAPVVATHALVQDVAAQARGVSVPRPDATLAAIAAATPRR